MEQKNYRPVVGEDKNYHIKEPSGGLYRNLKLLMLQGVITGVTERVAIAKEFKLVKDFTNKDELKAFQEKINKEEIGIEQFYEEAFKILFIESDKKEIKFDDLNLNQMNQAISDFFMKASGS